MLNKNYELKYLIKGLLFCLVFSIAALIILALVLKLTSLSESKLPLFNNLIMVISIAIGAIYASGKSNQNGWLIGAVIGLIYYIFILILSLIFIHDSSLSLFIIPKMLMAIISGIIGGIIGINLK